MNFTKATYAGIALLALVVSSGCTQTPHRIGGGLHIVTSSGAGFSSEGVTKSVYEEADKYAKERGKVVYIENIEVQEGRLGRQPPRAKLTFRLVEPNSGVADNQKLVLGLQKVQEVKKSIEERLKELKGLFDRGVITEIEYKKSRQGVLLNL